MVTKNFSLKMNRKTTILIILWLLPAILLSQKRHVEVIAAPSNDSIVLRWAPADPYYWRTGNSYGYKVVRFTLFRDSILLDRPEETVITPSELKPRALADWEELVKKDSVAMAAAQAIYGEEFTMDTGNTTGNETDVVPVAIYQRSEEETMRFSMALYAADISPEVAAASGLGFTDKTTKSNEKYLYRVFLNLPDSLASAGDTAFILTGAMYAVPLPSPEDFRARFGDRQVTLSWNSYVLSGTYIAYELQRSNNGKEYTSLSKNLTVPIVQEESGMPEQGFKIDSLPDNGEKYYYRIRGITSFGERGPWSAPVSGKGIVSIGAAPNISGYRIVDKGISITWEFPADHEHEINGFKISRSERHSGGFEEIGTVKPSSRSYTDNENKPTNYYMVEAFNNDGSSAISFPFLAQNDDTTAPVRPEGITGTTDTSWVVTLSWEENREEDLLGYIVLRSVSGNDEYTRLTPSPINNARYNDTLNKRDLNKSVYYKIAAIDQRQNISEMSVPVEISKPDIIPPTRPLIRNVTMTTEGVEIIFDKSNDDDISGYEVYRQIAGNTTWAKLESISSDITAGQARLTDPETPTGYTVVYKVTAIDNAGNRTDSPSSIAVKAVNTTKRENLEKISGYIDYENGKILLEWEPPQRRIGSIKIYRRTNNKEYSIYHTLEGNAVAFEDTGLKTGEEYGYRIKLAYDDGSVSGFSKEILIEY